MYDILTAILYDEPFQFRGKKAFTPPYSTAELPVANDLRKLDTEDAKALEKKIRAVAVEYRDQAFRTGVRFGAQMMAQLLEELQ